ncbi:MAG: hypothetical protein AAB944_01935 [Patescibacteria group bacterium]
MLLREEGRSGAVVLAGNVVPVGIELDLAVVKGEEWRVQEVANTDLEKKTIEV